MPVIADIAKPLGDGVIDLRLAAERDIPEILIAHEDDPEMHLRLGYERPPSGAQLGSLFERAPAERASGTYAALTITEAGYDLCRGGITVHNLVWEHARAELGLWLAPQVRGRGWAVRALRLSAGWLFAVTGLQRLAILTEPGNQPMVRAAQSAGFRPEGVLRGYARSRGLRVDNAILSLLASDGAR